MSQNTLLCTVFEANYKEGDCSYNGVYIASNGKVYFTINSHVLTYGVRIYETDPTTGQTRLFWDGANDLPDLQEAHVPQGKIHCPLAEMNGSIVCATHTGWYVNDHTIHGSNFALKPYKGGYVLADIANPKMVLIATGSEIGLAMEAKKVLDGQGIPTRVVSMPCTNVFDRQEQSYKASVLPQGVARVAIEAGVTDFWRKYVGLEGGVVGIDTFGESAPAPDLFKHFGFTVENVVNTAKAVL